MKPLGYGITRLAMIPIRKAPSHQSEQVTQLLFGEHYEILSHSSDGKWYYIRIYADKYKGWLDSKQHHSITVDRFDRINHTEHKITMELTANLLYNKKSITILMGSILPTPSSIVFDIEEQYTFNGKAKSIDQKKGVNFVKEIALRYLHTPYEWGGRSPFGIDCSGFAQLIFKIAGYHLLRDAHQQAKQGKTISTAAFAKPGDLAFFSENGKKISHVGLILDKKNIIHASGKVRVDRWTEDGILHAETGSLTHTLLHICNIIPPSFTNNQ